MKKHIILFGITAAFAAMLSGCKKTTDPINPNVATITLVNGGPKYLTGDATVNPKDTLIFQYTITSPVPMATVELDKSVVGSNNKIPSFAFKDSVKTQGSLTFTAIKKFPVDSAAGVYQYNVVARDINGLFLGQSKIVNVTVAPDFYFYTGRQLFVPDTVAKTNKCYFSTTDFDTYSYTSAGAAISPKIDFGYFFNTDSLYAANNLTASANVKDRVVGNSFYALSVAPAPSQIAMNDISGWTKNATQLAVGTTSTFVNLTSGGAITQNAITALKKSTSGNLSTSLLPIVTRTTKTVTSTVGGKTVTNTYNADAVTPITTGTIIYFKTVDGRYGAINVDLGTTATSAAKSQFVNISVKVTKK